MLEQAAAPSPIEMQQLNDFLSAPERPRSTFTLNELRGFLYAVACSPEPIISSDWLNAIFTGAEVEFSDIGETGEIADIIMTLYDQTVERIDQQLSAGTNNLPCELRDPILGNLEREAPLQQWSQGFLAGHEWLIEVWNEYLPPQLADQIDGMLVGPIFFSSRDAAESLFKETKHATLEELAENILVLFRESVLSYARLGLGLSAAAAEVASDIQMPIRSSERVGRNDPCPCDSGKKYKRCCGRAD